MSKREPTDPLDALGEIVVLAIWAAAVIALTGAAICVGAAVAHILKN